jgi:DNA modification methylase
MAVVPTICVDHLSPDEVRILALADNKIATLSGWDKELLAIELTELSQIAPEIDLTVTGFEIEQIQLLQDVAGSKAPPCAVEKLPAVDRSNPPVTLLGNCWQIGPHRLICGDALEDRTFADLLQEERADLVITDPPYNRKVDGEISGMGAIRHEEFVMASGEMSREQFQRFLDAMCLQLAKFSKPGSLHYIFMDWRSIGDLLAAGEAHYDALLNIIVWVKSNGGGMGSLYRSQHELVALFKRGKRPHKNNVALGVNGRDRTNVWQFSGANGAGKRSDLALHPTVKNLDMITEAIRDTSDQGDIILDAFGGSGTTLLGAHRAGRKARVIELDPYYCDLIVRRAIEVGLEAKLVGTDETFDSVLSARQASAGPACEVKT